MNNSTILSYLYDIKNDLDQAKSWGDVDRVGDMIQKLIDKIEG